VKRGWPSGMVDRAVFDLPEPLASRGPVTRVLRSAAFLSYVPPSSVTPARKRSAIIGYSLVETFETLMRPWNIEACRCVHAYGRARDLPWPARGAGGGKSAAAGRVSRGPLKRAGALFRPRARARPWAARSGA
jgi:hypothetical protein